MAEEPERSEEQQVIIEVAGLSRATKHYLSRKPTKRMAPFTTPWMLDLHREIFKGAWPWAGTIRKSRPDFIDVPTHRVRPCLLDLAEDLKVWQGDPVADSAMLHWRAEEIHPFSDGNGRWGRLLANIWLKQRTGQVVSWPDDIRDGASVIREEYLDALEAALVGSDDEFVELHRRFLM